MKKRSISVAIGLAVLASITWISFQKINRSQRVNAPVLESHSTKQVEHDIRSPYEIQEYINQHSSDLDLAQIWKQIGITTELAETADQCGCRQMDCPGSCNAEIIHDLTAKDNSSYVILRVNYGGGPDCWYVAFRRNPEWKYIGVVTSLADKYGQPKHRFEQVGSNQWLVITELDGGGTGFLSYQERWCFLSDHGFREVLLYPVSGHSIEDQDDDYELKSTVSKLKSESGFAVKIRYKVFTDKRYLKTRDWSWSQSHVDELIYDWDVATKQFRFAESKSRVEESKKDPIYSLLHITKRGFFPIT